jgi:hypothetical protein
MIIFLLDNSRRHEDETPFPHEKQIEDMRDSLDYAFATGKNFSFFSSLF